MPLIECLWLVYLDPATLQFSYFKGSIDHDYYTEYNVKQGSG